MDSRVVVIIFGIAVILQITLENQSMLKGLTDLLVAL